MKRAPPANGYKLLNPLKYKPDFLVTVQNICWRGIRVCDNQPSVEERATTTNMSESDLPLSSTLGSVNHVQKGRINYRQ